MRRLALFAAIAAAQLATAAQLKHVDGVRIFGKIHDLSVRQIRAVIAEATETRWKPPAIEILSSTEVRAYQPERQMGWDRYRLTRWAPPWNDRPPKWTLEGFGVDNTPEALRLIRTADQVYVCPVTFTPSSKAAEFTLHGNYKYLRLLGADARRKLGRLLGTKSHWFDGFDNTIMVRPESRNVGFIFRKGRDELVLLCYGRWRVAGTFNGEHTSASLKEKSSDRLDEWKQEYAKQELAIK
jgi:hypothetical protein